jgi:vacuolar-type H+-ATPase subunit I/STV1
MFFVEENNVRYLLGTTGLGLVYNNCPPTEKYYPHPSMSWIDPNSKLRDLLKIAEGIVEEDRKKEAEVIRLAAELKAKQEAEAKAAAELIAKQEAEAKAAAELQAKQEAEAKAAAELKTAAELKAEQEAEAKAAALKKTTLTCVKGKLTKKVTAVKPKCPSGYKLKK